MEAYAYAVLRSICFINHTSIIAIDTIAEIRKFYTQKN